MDNHTSNAIGAAIFVVACGAAAGVLQKAWNRRAFSVSSLLALMAIVAVATAIHVALGW